ncbi:MAG: GNAT family N-acetyltransferase [Candidatus Faecousia sp.]|nr:GNAT family N-acetyltransferase [Candidatus Faecousia sp.]
MTLCYEPACQEDLEPLFQLNKQLIEQYEDLSSIDYPKVLAWVRRNLQRNLSGVTRVLRDGILVGYFCLCREDGKLELDSLFVLPLFRGQGIGTEILRKCMREADVPVFLFVFRENTRAAALYRRMGFRIVKEAGKTRYIMENSLPR